jgi:hypothetical protein
MKHVMNYISDFMNLRKSFELFINNLSSALEKSAYLVNTLNSYVYS